MTESSDTCEFCTFLKLQSFNLESNSNSETSDSQSRNSKIKKKPRKIMKNLIALLGNGEWANSIPEAVAKLLIRNYPDLIEWDGKAKLVIFIPEFYLNKAVKYVEPARGATLLQANLCRRLLFLKHIFNLFLRAFKL